MHRLALRKRPIFSNISGQPIQQTYAHRQSPLDHRSVCFALYDVAGEGVIKGCCLLVLENFDLAPFAPITLHYKSSTIM